MQATKAATKPPSADQRSAKHTRPTSKINRTSWLNVISLLVSAPQVFSIVPKSHYILFWFSMYLCVSSCIFMYLFVSLCIFTYLYVSLCIFLFLTYLYVSFQPVPEDTYVSLRIFMYLSNPFRKIRMYLYVSLCICSTGFERYIKIPKDTLRSLGTASKPATVLATAWLKLRLYTVNVSWTKVAANISV